MSASTLRGTVRQRLQARIDEWTAEVMAGTSKPEAELRVGQGVVKGLLLAQAEVDEAYREMNS